MENLDIELLDGNVYYQDTFDLSERPRKGWKLVSKALYVQLMVSVLPLYSYHNGTERIFIAYYDGYRYQEQPKSMLEILDRRYE